VSGALTHHISNPNKGAKKASRQQEEEEVKNTKQE